MLVHALVSFLKKLNPARVLPNSIRNSVILLHFSEIEPYYYAGMSVLLDLISFFWNFLSILRRFRRTFLTQYQVSHVHVLQRTSTSKFSTGTTRVAVAHVHVQVNVSRTHLPFPLHVFDDPIVKRKVSISPFSFSYNQAFLQAFLQARYLIAAGQLSHSHFVSCAVRTWLNSFEGWSCWTQPNIQLRFLLDSHSFGSFPF